MIQHERLSSNANDDADCERARGWPTAGDDGQMTGGRGATGSDGAVGRPLVVIVRSGDRYLSQSGKATAG